MDRRVIDGCQVEILPAYTMDGPSYDEWTGCQATVVRSCSNGDDVIVDVKNSYDGEVLGISRRRLKRI
jgi:hypothetical protein